MVQKGLQGILHVMKLWWRRKTGHGNNCLTWSTVGHLALGELFTEKVVVVAVVVLRSL